MQAQKRPFVYNTYSNCFGFAICPTTDCCWTRYILLAKAVSVAFLCTHRVTSSFSPISVIIKPYTLIQFTVYKYWTIVQNYRIPKFLLGLLVTTEIWTKFCQLFLRRSFLSSIWGFIAFVSR